MTERNGGDGLSRAYDEASEALPPKIRSVIGQVKSDIKKCTWEIRLRTERPLTLTGSYGNMFVYAGGSVSPLLRDGALKTEKSDISAVFSKLCGYSVHSCEEGIREGFLTFRGGHRAGICGFAATENGRVMSVRDISSVNLRIARENKNAAGEICRRSFPNGPCGVIIAGAPSTGKTTVLRDLSRRLADGLCGRMYRVSVIDGRGEIAAVQNGVPNFDVGAACDVFTGYPKKEAVITALRSMSPEVMICDEISDEKEADSIAEGFNSGVDFAVSVHASDLNDLLRRPASKYLLMTGAFDSVVFLKSGDTPCVIDKIYKVGELTDEISARFRRVGDLRRFGAEDEPFAVRKSEAS